MGSSPLTRGKLRERIFHVIKPGLIPAHAGKTRTASRAECHSEAHPRSRGENPYAASQEQDPKGSSPLTRGKLVAGSGPIRAYGLIPAHAGKTPPWIRRARASRAHPRSRGENDRPSIQRAMREGSSPLTRGKPVGLRNRVSRCGLIPAHAGKTSSASAASKASRAHPRSRGENSTSDEKPARGMAHPRSRGENTEEDSLAGLIQGSSPLTRGKQALVRRAGGCGRLIPAHAGKTIASVPRSTAPGAHPRSRGENCPVLRGPSPCKGSSPLTRGKRYG